MNEAIFILLFFTTLIISIVFHELGHLTAFRSLGIKAKIIPYYDNILRFGIKTGKRKDYIFLDDKKLKYIGFMGIYYGLFPIFFAGIFNNFFYLLLVPYIIGCLHDLEIIFKRKRWDLSKY